MDSKQMKPLSLGKISTREVDGLLAIGGDLKRTYHTELQSTPDGTIVVCFWEYASDVAMKTAEIMPNGRMRIKYPCSALLYLRHSANTPDKLTIEVENAKGEVFDIHEIPVVKVQGYDLDELFQKDLLFLLPFYSFRHEKVLAEYDGDESKFAALREDMDRILKKLDEERNAGRIDAMMLRAMHVAIMTVLRSLGGEHVNVTKGVEKMLAGEILDDVLFRVHDKAWDEGEAKGMQLGEQKGMLSTLFGLVRKGRLTSGEASEEAGIPLPLFDAKMAEYEASLQA